MATRLPMPAKWVKACGFPKTSVFEQFLLKTTMETVKTSKTGVLGVSKRRTGIWKV
jgi:hypothetical protein